MPPAASTRTLQADPPQGARRKRPRSEEKEEEEEEEEEEEMYASEKEQLQLVLARSLYSAEDERRDRLERRSNRKALVARGSDEEDSEEGEEEALAVRVAGALPALCAVGSALSSLTGNEQGSLADEGGEEEEKGTCFCAESFVGEPSNRPEWGAPESGWGYTTCCTNPVHFDCLRAHLDPTDKLVDSTSGRVQMDLGCPFCRAKLSRSSRRQLCAEGRCVRAIHILYTFTSNT